MPVRWKEVLVVGQHDKVIARNQSVGGIAVDHVDLSGGQRLVFHCGTQDPHRVEVQAVRTLQAGQSIGPADKVRCQPGADRSADTREIRESS
jgi:hypothetical protein